MTGEFAGKVFPLTDHLLIGRQDSVDLRIADLEVSRRHCEIQRTANGFQLKDLGSRSGTRLNDKPVQVSPIRSGDILSVGPYLFRFELETAERLRGETMAPATMAIDSAGGQMMLQEILLSDFSLAKQLGTATEETTLVRLRRNLEVVQDFAEAIQTTLDTAALMERTLDELFRVFAKMDAGVIFLRDPANGQLAPAAIRRRKKTDSGPVGYSTTILHSAEGERKAVVILDVSQDERFQNAVSVRLGEMRTHMCVPLIVRGEVVGAVYLVAEGQETPTTGFDADDLRLLSALAGTVAVCVKNAALAREARRSAQLSSSLQRYVSADVTKRLLEQGVEGVLSARMAEGVALFCDIVGFTTLSEQLPPDRMAKILNRYFRRALDIVFARNGSVNKFGGDAFLAVWGAIEPAENDLINAIRAALEIQNDSFRLSRELAAEGVGSIQLTIGLNRGRFFAGDIGSDDRMEFTVIGDTVNVAARIQALAHGSQVLTTLDSLGDACGQMSLLLYPDIPIRGRSSGATIASIRAIFTGPGSGLSAPSKAKEAAASPDDPTNPPESRSHSGRRVLASIPIELPDLNAQAMLVGALLETQVEIDLLADRAAPVGEVLRLVPTVPEWEGTLPPAEAVCMASLSEEPIHLIRLQLTKPTAELLTMLRPGTAVTAARPLRKKS